MLVDVPEWRRDILQEHLEELEALWNRRTRALRWPEADAIALRRIDARLDAHADALVLAGEHAWPLLEPALSGEPPVAAAATLALASTNDPEADEAIVSALEKAAPTVQLAMGRALELRAGPGLCRLLPAGPAAPPVVAAIGCAVLVARGGALPPRHHWPLLTDTDPAVRALAWRVEGRLGPARRRDPDRVTTRDYQVAFADTDEEVRRSALEAAARSGLSWLLDHLRAAAKTRSPTALAEHLLFAALNEPADTSSAVALGATPALAWDRFRVLALLGRREAVEELLRAMRAGPDVETALAGAAFFRVTGVDVERPERLPLTAPGADPDELADEIKACDVGKAEREWRRISNRLGAQGRWSRGTDIESQHPAELPAAVDLETRWGAHLRRAFREGAAVALDDERFPFG